MMTTSLEIRKFGVDVTWNLASFCVMAVAGIVVNLLIARYYGPATLGVFNQAFTVYLVVSQLAVFGIWQSALKHISEQADDRSASSAIATAALVLAGVLALLFTAIGYLLADPIEAFFDSQYVASAWLMILPGLWPYSINKVFMAVLNGQRKMRAYALAQISRYALIVAVLCTAIWMDAEGTSLTLAISLPEFAVLAALVANHARSSTAVAAQQWRPWIARHLSFGAKAMPGGVLADLNTRVDLLILGFFLSDARVGVYSMAALIAEGLAQVSIALRDNLNPVLARLVVAQDMQRLRHVIRRMVWGFGMSLAGVLVVAAMVYPRALHLLTGGASFDESWKIFLILATGLAVNGGYLPLNMILVLGGFPGRQTQHRFITLAVNVLLGLLLVPIFDIYGAALAVTVSGIASTLYLKVLAHRYLRIKI